jgi:hypothetical protein
LLRLFKYFHHKIYISAAGKEVVMDNGRKIKHLSEQDRNDIWKLLSRGLNFREIGEAMGRDATTISKEVKKHRYLHFNKMKYGDVRDHPCALNGRCKKRNLCNNKKCRIPCKACLHCHKHCKDFTLVLCDIERKPPYVCNGCEKRLHNRCKESKYFYNSDVAHKEYL